MVPARNEADSIAQSITSLLSQDYPALAIVLVDDDSDDGTADIARRAAAALGKEDRLTIVNSGALPPRWTGKLWAVKQGIAAARGDVRAEISDAHRRRHRARARTPRAGWSRTPRRTIWCSPRSRRAGAARALAERVHIPAFIFFFQMLYPFAWVNRPDNATAAARPAAACWCAPTRCARPAASTRSATR